MYGRLRQRIRHARVDQYWTNNHLPLGVNACLARRAKVADLVVSKLEKVEVLCLHLLVPELILSFQNLTPPLRWQRLNTTLLAKKKDVRFLTVILRT